MTGVWIDINIIIIKKILKLINKKYLSFIMNSQNLMVIDPALEVPEIESFNGIVARSPIKATYHLPALHSPVSMHEQI